MQLQAAGATLCRCLRSADVFQPYFGVFVAVRGFGVTSEGEMGDDSRSEASLDLSLAVFNSTANHVCRPYRLQGSSKLGRSRGRPTLSVSFGI